jgi:aralkylamine N-acetyltransferase
MNIEVKKCLEPDKNCSLQISSLYMQAGWIKESDLENIDWVSSLVKGSSVFVTVLDKTVDKIIGMGRAISDNVSDSYIQDVFVLTKYRGNNIGEQIIRTIILELKNKGVSWIGLIAQPGGSAEFYKKLGFRIMQDHQPMLLDLKIINE